MLQFGQNIFALPELPSQFFWVNQQMHIAIWCRRSFCFFVGCCFIRVFCVMGVGIKSLYCYAIGCVSSNNPRVSSHNLLHSIIRTLCSRPFNYYIRSFRCFFNQLPKENLTFSEPPPLCPYLHNTWMVHTIRYSASQLQTRIEPTSFHYA